LPFIGAGNIPSSVNSFSRADKSITAPRNAICIGVLGHKTTPTSKFSENKRIRKIENKQNIKEKMPTNRPSSQGRLI